MDTLRRMSTLLLLPLLLVVLLVGCKSEDDPVEGGPRDDLITPGDELSGELTGTLSGRNTIADSAWVPEGETLVLQPGAELYFLPDAYMNVYGTLDARGTNESWIKLTSARAKPDRGDWHGLRFINASDNSEMEYVQVSYAARYSLRADTSRNRSNEDVIPEIFHYRGAVSVQNTDLTIQRCVIDYGGYDGVQIVGDSQVKLLHNTIANNAFNGVRVEPDWSLPFDQIFTSVAKSTISNNIIVENDDAGVRIYDNDQIYANGMVPELRYNDIWNNASLSYVPPTTFARFSDTRTDIHIDPVFVDPEGDYNLHPCSGVIDRGTPVADGGNADPDGTRPDMGAIPLYQGPYDLAKNLRNNIYINPEPGVGSTLTLEGGQTYYVRCDAYVPDGVQLVIPANTRLAFQGLYSLYVYGDIQSNGTAGGEVVFTSAKDNPQRGDWRQLVLDDADDASTLTHTIVEYGSMESRSAPEPDTLGALTIIASNPTLSHVTVRESFYAGLHTFNGSNPTVEDLTVTGTGLHGIVCELNSSPTFARTVVHNVLGYGLYLVTNSSPTFTNLLMYDVHTSGILAKNLSSPEIDYATIFGRFSENVGIENPVTSRFSYGLRADEFARPVLRNSIIAEFANAGVRSQVSSRPSLDHIGLYTETTADSTLGSVSVNNVMTQDPRFVDPDGGDFNLGSNSPYRTAGPNGEQLGAYGPDGNGMSAN